MTKEEAQIKLDFESVHPALMKLNPEINVCTVIEEWDEDIEQFVLVHPNRIEIEIKHNFIFDNRLVCSEINGIPVFNIVVGQAFPDSFFEGFKSGDPIPLYKLEAPENYVEFVNTNLEQIREKLSAPNMSISEALDAIVATGDFQKHIQYVNDLEAKFKKI